MARIQTIPRHFSTSKDPNAIWTWKFLGLLKRYDPKDIIYRPWWGPLSSNKSVSSKAGKGQLGPAPLSLGSFLLIYLFQIPFCYLGWKFHTCSAQRNAALAGQRASQEMRSNFAFVASFHLWLLLSQLWGRLCYCLSCTPTLSDWRATTFIQVTSSREPLLTSTSRLVPDL